MAMNDKTRTMVTFLAAGFNTSENKPHFNNPGNYGEDVLEWLRARLRAHNIEVEEEIGQEDFGWYLTFKLRETSCTFILGFREEVEWLGWIERNAGILASIFGGRKKNIPAEASQIIHRALSDGAVVKNIRWHFPKDFDALREELGQPEP